MSFRLGFISIIIIYVFFFSWRIKEMDVVFCKFFNFEDNYVSGRDILFFLFWIVFWFLYFLYYGGGRGL